MPLAAFVWGAGGVVLARCKRTESSDPRSWPGTASQYKSLVVFQRNQQIQAPILL